MTQTKKDVSVYIPLLDKALEQEIGLVVMTNHPKRLREDINDARRQAANPAHSDLITFIPDGADRVFICKKSAELPA